MSALDTVPLRWTRFSISGNADRVCRAMKARDFEGVGGPEDKAAMAESARGGDDDVRGNVRQGGETKRP